MSHHGSIHIHKRKRGRVDGSSVLLLDRVCTVFAVFMPLTTLPQIYKIYHYQDASGLSLWTWVLYSIGVIPFLLYGIVHRVPHLIVLNALWIVAQIVLIVGINLYG